mmetsp:Transcript_108790/g.188235  ORF Transcript_108790/g.188235 Transcript_108790/m.188235 type:complete len:90 (-) Transcript_108790:331-600(-)
MPIGPCNTNTSMHTANLLLGGTPHALFIEVIDPVWDDGCLGHAGSWMDNHQGYPSERTTALTSSWGVRFASTINKVVRTTSCSTALEVL